jgi:tetratricopeptide (TPR) repeat protein
MKTLFLFLVSSLLFSQESLSFDTEYYDAVDKWVAIPVNDSIFPYTYGFIYLDETTGFTFDAGKMFKIDEKGNFVKNVSDTADISIKARIPQSWKKVAIIPNHHLKDLGLPETPDWLKFYKENEGSAEYLTKIGYFYNDVGASHNAIEPLEKAYSIDSTKNDLIFELVYAYNATQEFQKAIQITENTINKGIADCLLYRELLYAYKNLDKLPKAENVYETALGICDDNSSKSEMAVNLAQTYFFKKDEAKFRKWIAEARKYTERNSQYGQFLDLLESKWSEENKE